MAIKISGLGISSYASYIHAIKVGSVVTIGDNYLAGVGSIAATASNTAKRTIRSYISIY